MKHDISGEYTLQSEREMGGLAKEVAFAAETGDVLLLTGEVGAGKTTFVKALARALSVNSEVTSPTFTLAVEYEVPQPHALNELVHVDLYRLGHSAEGVIGGEEEAILREMLDMAPQLRRLVAIEWANKLPSMSEGGWQQRAWQFHFSHGKSEQERYVSIHNSLGRIF